MIKNPKDEKIMIKMGDDTNTDTCKARGYTNEVASRKYGSNNESYWTKVATAADEEETGVQLWSETFLS